jgi:transcriptional regulator with XRE-family HTH domain
MADCTAAKHGDENAYTNHGCTCDDAREDRRVKEKRRREGRHVSPYIDVTGTSRRLRALAALGWSREDLAEQLGCSPQLVERHRTGRLQRLHVSAARRYKDLYERLQGTPGPSAVARAHAARAGWAPPLAWDDDALDDPTAQPTGVGAPAQPARVNLDEVRFLEPFGVSRYEIARRMNVAPEAIERAEYRAQARARAAVERAREAIRAATQPPADEAEPTRTRELEHAR